MFQFTTTNVINSKQYFEDGDRWVWDADRNVLFIKRVAAFKPENVTAIYKAESLPGINAKVTFDFGTETIAKGTECRLDIYVGLTQGSNDSRFSNDYTYKGKPFSVDFRWGASAEKTVEDLVKVINQHELFVFGSKLIKVSANGTCLTLEATSEYQRFVKLSLLEFDPVPHLGLGEYNEIKTIEELEETDDVTVLDGTTEGIFKGQEGFGTYSFIMQNLRLPTEMRTRAFGINQDETPIVGAEYDLYTIHYCVNRGILGTNAVGDTVQSATTHVFYVLKSLSSEFEAALTNLKKPVTVPETRDVAEP